MRCSTISVGRSCLESRFTMNNTAFPAPGPKPTLKLSRRPHGGNDDLQQRHLADELAEIREREANLAEYEARLRSWQAQLDEQNNVPISSTSSAPFLPASTRMAPGSDAALRSAWDRLHRARELLAAEQNQVRDERLALRDAERQVKQREADVTAREAKVALREQAIAAAEAPRTHKNAGDGAVKRLTQAPFRVARAMFGTNE